MAGWIWILIAGIIVIAILLVLRSRQKKVSNRISGAVVNSKKGTSLVTYSRFVDKFNDLRTALTPYHLKQKSETYIRYIE